MTKDADESVILVGYPPGLGQYDLFSGKIDQLVAHLGTMKVVSLDDRRGFCRKKFGERVVAHATAAEMSLEEQKSLVASCTHAILFWNGTDLTSFVHLCLFQRLKTRIIPIRTTEVVNKDRGQDFDVYIGRKGPWGNPYVIGKDGDRSEVIAKYREYFYSRLLNDPSTKQGILSLKGLRLGCHCKPYPCHGDVIAEYLNTLPSEAPRASGASEESNENHLAVSTTAA